MKEQYLDMPLVRNEEERQFELHVGDGLARIVYAEGTGRIALLHTEVTPDLEGQGAATAIIEKTLVYIEEHQLKLLPLCPLVGAYLERHPEWKRILVD